MSGGADEALLVYVCPLAKNVHYSASAGWEQNMSAREGARGKRDARPRMSARIERDVRQDHDGETRAVWP